MFFELTKGAPLPHQTQNVDNSNTFGSKTFIWNRTSHPSQRWLSYEIYKSTEMYNLDQSFLSLLLLLWTSGYFKKWCAVGAVGYTELFFNGHKYDIGSLRVRGCSMCSGFSLRLFNSPRKVSSTMGKRRHLQGYASEFVSPQPMLQAWEQW